MDQRAVFVGLSVLTVTAIMWYSDSSTDKYYQASPPPAPVEPPETLASGFRCFSGKNDEIKVITCPKFLKRPNGGVCVTGTCFARIRSSGTFERGCGCRAREDEKNTCNLYVDNKNRLVKWCQCGQGRCCNGVIPSFDDSRIEYEGKTKCPDDSPVHGRWGAFRNEVSDIMTFFAYG